MDKYEYKVRADEIKELIANGEYVQAVEIADTIDWRRVKSITMLCTISDLYKMNRRYDEAKELLEMAYDRHPSSRTICYSLCELAIKTEDYIHAFEYYKQFIQIAPRDPGKYILKYKIYAAQDVSLEERIEVLKELKDHNEYHEKWLYELAYLYHRLGLVSQCVDECDELIAMFGSGKYVIKAMELKMLHQPLSAEQQRKYDHRFEFEMEESEETAKSEYYGNDIGNEDKQEALHQKEAEPETANRNPEEALEEDPEVFFLEPGAGDTKIYEKKQVADAVAAAEGTKEPEIKVNVMDPDYNTMNLQETVANGIREYLGEDAAAEGAKDRVMEKILEPMIDGDTESLDFPEIHEVSESDLEPDNAQEVIEETEVFFGETGELPETEKADGDSEDRRIERIPEEKESPDARGEKSVTEIPASDTEDAASSEAEEEDAFFEEAPGDVTAETVMEQLRQENLKTAAKKAMEAQPPKAIASVLSQEDDGQISFIVPETQNIERQITGQLNLDDIILEWERMKKENAEKNEEAVRKHVKEQTGELFTEFEASLRDSLLEKLEKENEASKDPISDDDEVEELTEIEEADTYTEPEEVPADVSVVNTAGMAKTGAEILSAAEGKTLDADEEQEFFVEAKEDSEEAMGHPDIKEAEPEQQSPAIAEDESGDAETVSDGEAAKAESGQESAKEEETQKKEAQSDQTEETGKMDSPEREKEKPAHRSLTREEKELFTDFIQSRSAREQLVNVIDNATMAAYTGNIIITGDEGTETITLCKNIVKELKMADGNLTGRIAKISGKALNNKNVPEMIQQLSGGALIIQKASGMKDEIAESLYQTLQNEGLGIMVILEDTMKAMDRFLAKHDKFRNCFTNRMDVQALNNDTLVAYGKQYARSMEYSIDELGILAFHTKIEERQTLEHAVTAREVKDIIDRAIHHANRKTLGHFFDILLAKRYDEEDMIVLGEKDFV